MLCLASTNDRFANISILCNTAGVGQACCGRSNARAVGDNGGVTLLSWKGVQPVASVLEAFTLNSR